MGGPGRDAYWGKCGSVGQGGSKGKEEIPVGFFFYHRADKTQDSHANETQDSYANETQDSHADETQDSYASTAPDAIIQRVIFTNGPYEHDRLKDEYLRGKKATYSTDTRDKAKGRSKSGAP